MKKTNKGFTLIELLVVIAIIGILSAIVLASLSNARTKANDTKVKGQLSGIRAAAEIYYGVNNNYGPTVSSCTAATSLFTDTASGAGLAGLLASGNYPAGTSLDCGSSGTAWSVAASLSTASSWWCVDSTGASKGTQGTGVTGYTALTGAGTAAHTAAGATVCN